MRNDIEVNDEIVKLIDALESPRWDARARKWLNEQIKVLTARMSIDQVEETYLAPAIKRGGGIVRWMTLDSTVRWLNKEQGYNPPSSNLP
jgi:hypothetical protein